MSIAISELNEQQRIVAYPYGMQVKGNELWELQSATGKEFYVLLPSMLDKAFKGEL